MTPLATSTFLQVLFGTLLVIPVMILWVAAVFDVIVHGRSGWKIAAVLVLILIVPIVGPLLYFVFRGPTHVTPEAAHMADVDRRAEAARRPVPGTGEFR